jgi:hypothetical protein
MHEENSKMRNYMTESGLYELAQGFRTKTAPSEPFQATLSYLSISRNPVVQVFFESVTIRLIRAVTRECHPHQ